MPKCHNCDGSGFIGTEDGQEQCDFCAMKAPIMTTESSSSAGDVWSDFPPNDLKDGAAYWIVTHDGCQRAAMYIDAGPGGMWHVAGRLGLELTPNVRRFGPRIPEPEELYKLSPPQNETTGGVK